MRAGAWRRRTWNAAISLALVGALVAAPQTPIRGIDGQADYRAVYSACVGNATASAGFQDLVGLFAEKAADCLAHYGITSGVAPGQFSPGDAVPRWQMALFLVRAAGPAGIVVPQAIDQGFTDLAGLAPPERDAINQLAAIGITRGTKASAFVPYGEVTRRQMALFLSRFLERASLGPGGKKITDVKPDDQTLRDLDGLSYEAHEAIRKLFEMGVTAGTTARTFSPDAPVSRAQMAVFLARVLDHTNARPSGLTIQTVSTQVFKNSDLFLSISVRDTDHQPVSGRPVDIFTALDPSVALQSDGTCADQVMPAVGDSACMIDTTDPATDTHGNLLAAVWIESADSLRIWTWTGEPDTVFDQDTAKFRTIDITTRKEAVALEVSDDLPPGVRKVRYGEAVTFTFRLIDGKGGTVARPGFAFTARLEESRTGLPGVTRTTIEKETGADGSTRLTHRFVDPTGEPGDVSRLDLDVQTSGGLRVNDRTTLLMVQNDGDRLRDRLLEWTDLPATPSDIGILLTKPYRLASDAGGGAANTVRATLVDQYGGPVVGERVIFTSNDSAGVPQGVRRTTGQGGVAALNYQRDSAVSGVETIKVQFEDLSRSIRQYWVTPASVGEIASGSVLAVQSAERTIIVTVGARIVIIEYDANDRFSLAERVVSLSDFERALDVRDPIAYQITGTTPGAVNLFDLAR